MSEKQPITVQGFKALNEELKKLVNTERPAIARDIAEARSHGDLKENAEYHAAKEKQGMIEAKISQINEALATCQVVDTSTMSGDTVKFGAHVEFENLETGEVMRYQIVGPSESDSAQGKISVTSPIGRALIGKKEGEETLIQIPKGEMEIVINSVSYK